MKQFLQRIVHLIPATSNAWWYWGVFPRRVAAVRGVYPTWKSAQEATATRHHVRPKTEILTYRASDETRIHPLAERDYPVVLHMQHLLRPDTRLVNIGGSLAKEYESYRSLMPFPAGLRWHICEVPQVAAAGQKMVDQGDYPGLSFGTEISGSADILLICGALQYLTATLPDVLTKFDNLPDHIFLSRTPMQGRVPRFYTVQNIGSSTVPYRIENETTFVNEMVEAGYTLQDAWRDQRKLVIPWYQDGNVDGYLGFYFKRTALASRSLSPLHGQGLQENHRQRAGS